MGGDAERGGCHGRSGNDQCRRPETEMARRRRHRWRRRRGPSGQCPRQGRRIFRGPEGGGMTSPAAFTLAEARDALKAKKISSKELTGALVKSVEGARGLNAYVTETAEKALSMAEASDARLAKGEGGALEGLPLAIKDLFCTKGVRTTAGSKILGNFLPPYESTVTANLWKAGAVMLGKTNLDEFAMGSSNETSAFGPVFNPWRAKNSNAKLVPGGSSGGSATAVAGDLCLAATGTDTGGSIRQPAAVTGRVGLKPTYGRCSRFGIVAFASSLDQA